MRASDGLLAAHTIALLGMALPGGTAMAATPDERVAAYQECRGSFDKGD